MIINTYAEDGYAWREIRLWPFKRWLRWHSFITKRKGQGIPYKEWPDGWK